MTKRYVNIYSAASLLVLLVAVGCQKDEKDEKDEREEQPQTLLFGTQKTGAWVRIDSSNTVTVQPGWEWILVRANGQMLVFDSARSERKVMNNPEEAEQVQQDECGIVIVGNGQIEVGGIGNSFPQEKLCVKCGFVGLWKNHNGAACELYGDRLKIVKSGESK